MFKNPIHFCAGDNRTRVDLYCFRLGKDFQVIIVGGDYHIGAVALGLMTMKSGHKEGRSAVIFVPGHREDKIAESISTKLCNTLNTNFAVTCGIHYDNLTKDELNEILSNVEMLSDQLIDNLIKL